MRQEIRIQRGLLREEEERQNAFNSGHHVPPAMPNGSAHTSLRPIVIFLSQATANPTYTMYPQECLPICQGANVKPAANEIMNERKH